MFERPRRPLSVGILDDILARLGDRIERQQLGPALRFYTGNVFYRRAQRAGTPRIDLDGQRERHGFGSRRGERCRRRVPAQSCQKGKAAEDGWSARACAHSGRIGSTAACGACEAAGRPF
jgi:sRNA-binding protein